MGGDDLQALARLALDDHLSPRLPEKVLTFLARQASAAAGILERGGVPMARCGEAPAGQGEGWWELEVLPGEAPWVAYLMGGGPPAVNGLVAAQLALRAWELREELRASRLGERLRLWELEAIRTLAAGIGGILDPTTLGQEMIMHLVMLMGVRRAELLLGDGPGEARRVVAFGGTPSEDVDLTEAWSGGWTGERILARPLVSSSGVLGLVLVGDKEARSGEQPFSADDQRLLELFAVQAAVALENAKLYRDSLEKERLNRELEVAAEIQSYLQPRDFPDMAGFRVTARRLPARFVAGDCFAVAPVQGGVEVLAADVSGKGVGAGLIAAGLQAGARLLAESDEPLPVKARRLNGVLHEATEDHRFATGVLLRCMEGGACSIINAGHPPVFVKRRAGPLERVDATGLPLGVLPDAVYRERTLRLSPGETVLVYTDGVTEAESPGGEELGVERLAALVEACEGEGAVLCEAVLDAVHHFTGGRPAGDDITVVAVERLDDAS